MVSELEELARSLGIILPGQIENTVNYRMPVEGKLISQHTPGAPTPTHPQGHFGLDIQNKTGTPVYAIGPGKVIAVYNENNNPKGGNAVKISHEGGVVTSYYAHLNEVNVSKGENVDQNTQIGTVGTSGMIYNGKKRITSPHLHFQVKVNNNDINPNYIANKEVGSFSRTAKVAEMLEKKYF